MAWSKESRHKRGYGSEWDKLRLTILARDCYLCQCERCQGGKLRLTVATQVDHRISKADWLRRHGTLDGCDDQSNLRAISGPCHQRKGIEEKGQKPRPRIGADGYPVEESGRG
jgi:5-methylcytosine-specific restriction protein A